MAIENMCRDESTTVTVRWSGAVRWDGDLETDDRFSGDGGDGVSVHGFDSWEWEARGRMVNELTKEEGERETDFGS